MPHAFAPVFATGLIVMTLAASAGGQRAPVPLDASVHNDAKLLWMPDPRFADEIARLRPADFRCPPAVRAPRNTHQSIFESSTGVDLEELGLALDDLKVGPGRKADLIDQYAAVRREIGRRLAQDLRRPEFDIPFPIPAGIPQEFGDYLQALLWSHNGQTDDARALWEKIVAMPADSRRYRGPWATFMLGRSYLNSNPVRAIQYFEQTRQWIGDRPDRLGLASSSLGWEGRAMLNLDRDPEAADLYLRQAWTGDPTAVTSLQIALQTLLRDPPAVRREVLANPLLRRAMTALVTGDNDPFIDLTDDDRRKFPGWLSDLVDRGVTDPDEIDRLAWAAYCRTANDAASSLLERGNPRSPLHQLLIAKLLLSNREVDRAVPVLQSICPLRRTALFPLNDPDIQDAFDGPETAEVREIARGDLVALLLTRQRYDGALDLLIDARNPDRCQDTGYVAERLLTVGELHAFVDRISASGRRDRGVLFIRGLLGGRLARDGKLDEADGYFDPATRDRLRVCRQKWADAHDTRLSTEARATALMDAARWTAQNGDPVFGIHFGRRDRDRECTRQPNTRSDTAAQTPLTAPSEDELARYDEGEKNDQTLGAEIKGADLAWEAAALWPDNSPQKLDDLYTAGEWLRASNPKAADRFYKEICRHCGQTEVGKKCIAAHWFAGR